MTKSQRQFNYPALVDEAMRSVVREVLQHVYHEDLHGDHHFFISFNTRCDGVRLSPQLIEQYPSEMTIVMQHQFWDLQVEEDFFSLMLSFNNIPEKLVIPYDALTAFADPSVKFGLQFHTKPAANDKPEFALPQRPAAPAPVSSSTASFEEASDESNDDDNNNVISIDAFRK